MDDLFEADKLEVAADSFANLTIDEVQQGLPADRAKLGVERESSPPLHTLTDLDKADGIDAPRPAEAGRARTQEITSSFKVIPQINYTLRDWHGLENELDEWFESFPDAAQLLEVLAETDVVDETEIVRELLAVELTSDFTRLLYYALGCFATVESFGEHRAVLLQNCKTLLDANVLDTLNPKSDNIMELSLLFVLVAAGLETEGDRIAASAIVQKLMHHIASFRWSETFEIGPHVVLLRASMLCVFGGERQAADCHRYLYASCGVELDAECDEVLATPLDYEGFRQTIMARYPSYIPPEADPETQLSLFERPPARPVMPNLVAADVPASIEEACELFRQKTQKTPEVVQFWAEQRRFLRGGEPAPPLPADTPVSLRRVEEVYNDTLLVAKSFATVLLNYILQESAKEELGGGSGLHSACLVLRILLRWYRLSHVLKFEFLAAILFDLQFHLITFKYCSNHAILETVLADAPAPQGFWAETKALSEGRHLNDVRYGFDEREKLLGSVSSVGGLKNGRTDGIHIESFSPRALEVFISLVGVTRAIISDKTQRIVIVAELPAEALKQLLLVYNRQLWMEALQIFKLQAPFNGKKWRSLNMELISAIYLHCPPKLNDNWLSGQDVSGEIKVAASQEETLRNMIEFYNSSRPGLEPRTSLFF